MKEVEKTENVSQQEEQTGTKMNITKEQAKYWYAVANDNSNCGIYRF